MTTPRDNSNITEQDVLDATISLQEAKAKRDVLEAEIAELEEKLNTRNTAIPFPTSFYDNDRVGENIIKDWTAVATKAVPFNPPRLRELKDAGVFMQSERANYNQGRVFGDPVERVWVQEYKTSYGSYFSPISYSRNTKLFNAIYTNLPIELRQPDAASVFELDEKEVAYWKLIEALNIAKFSLTKTLKKITENENTIDNGPSIDLLNSDGTLSLTPFIGLVYNVGSVQEAYLSPRQTFTDLLTTFSRVNTPSAVTNASQLWVTGGSHKGMIQPSTKASVQTAVNSISEVTLPTTDAAVGYTTQKLNPTAFQFLYNPASVDMVYSGTLGVDPNMQTNGLDQFNPAGMPGLATLNFNILLNRMFDFRYYDSTTGAVDAKHRGKKLYYPREPELAEQKDIYKKGTMYDVEYLLRAILGFGMASYLGRNMSDGKTADIGFITAAPIELHLGNNLRYLGYVTELRVSHVLFDERMVPIFTNLSISFNRLVDPVDSARVSMGTSYRPDGYQSPGSPPSYDSKTGKVIDLSGPGKMGR
jgi:hypothetical protein